MKELDKGLFLEVWWNFTLSASIEMFYYDGHMDEKVWYTFLCDDYIFLYISLFWFYFLVWNRLSITRLTDI